MKITEKKILAQAAAIRERENAKKLRESVDQLRKLVGRCFRYRNSYGCGDTKGPWWTWMRIESVDADGGFRALSFEVDNSGRITVKPNEWSMSLLEGYKEVTEAELTTAFLAMRNLIKL